MAGRRTATSACYRAEGSLLQDPPVLVKPHATVYE